MTNVIVRGYEWVGNKLMSIKHPILTLIIIGIVIRLILSVSTFIYDVNYWGLVIRNIKIDQGLYGLDGYYYPPVWGYCLGLLAAFQDFCLNIGEMAVKVTDFNFTEISNVPFIITTSMIPTLAFAYSVKIPLIILDIVFAYLVYVLAKDYGADEKKALLAFALAFICPTIMHTSCVVSMPDVIGATFTVLTVILLKRNYVFFAGMTFSLAILTKFFPVFLLLPLVAYVIAKNRDNRNEMFKQIGFAFCGFALASVVIFLPYIMAGNLMDCFQFITDRLPFLKAEVSEGMLYSNSILANNIDVNTIIDGFAKWTRILVYLLVGIVSIYFAYRMIKDKDVNVDDKMIKMCFVIMILCLLLPPTAQYVCIVIPFLAFWIVMRDRKFVISWVIIAVGALLLALMFDPMQLTPWALNGFLDMNTLLEWYNVYANYGDPISFMTVQHAMGSIILYVGILTLLWFMYEDKIRDVLNLRKEKTDEIQ